MKQDPSQQIESILQQAPRPTPPEGLKQRLTQDSARDLARHEGGQTVRIPSLFGIWIPRLGFALVFTLAAVFITAQTNRLPSLKEAKQTLQQLEVERDQLAKNLEERSKQRERLSYLEELQQQQEEIVQLKQERAKLTTLLSEMTALAADNQSLQKELLQLNGSRELLTHDPIGEAREQARHTQCVNNLKNLGLAYHIANSKGLPVSSILDLAAHLNNDSALFCPNDEARTDDTLIDNGDMEAASSYVWKLHSPERGNSSTVLIQCPFHLSISLFDGSVQSGKRLSNGEISLVEDEGNLRIEHPTQ